MSVKIFIVSDFTGETAEHVAKAATSQFNGKDSEMVRFRYVNNQDRLMEIIEGGLKGRCPDHSHISRSSVAKSAGKGGENPQYRFYRRPWPHSWDVGKEDRITAKETPG